MMGEGLGLSFRQALALADALEAGELREYQAPARRTPVTARRLRLLDQFAPRGKRVRRALANDLFRRVPTAHVSETSPRFWLR